MSVTMHIQKSWHSPVQKCRKCSNWSSLKQRRVLWMAKIMSLFSFFRFYELILSPLVKNAHFISMWLQLHLFSHCDQLQKAETSEADEVDEEPAVVQSTQLFAPKSLVLVSRLDYTEVFRVRTHLHYNYSALSASLLLYQHTAHHLGCTKTEAWKQILHYSVIIFAMAFLN